MAYCNFQRQRPGVWRLAIGNACMGTIKSRCSQNQAFCMKYTLDQIYQRLRGAFDTIFYGCRTHQRSTHYVSPHYNFFLVLINNNL
jgi:hypothetical protein